MVKLLEYEAKQLLQKADIPTPKSEVIKIGDSPTYTSPCVVKSQVPVGGRGKAGGVRIVNSSDELRGAIDDISTLEIKGHLPKTLLIEELIAIDREYYLSLVINRSLSAIELVAHHDGGIDIESRDTDEFFRRSITDDNFDGIGDSLADYLDLPDKAFIFQDLVEKLYHCFVTNDATLLEINPFVLTQSGKLVAADGKIELDNDAAFRHPDWQFEESLQSANFITLDPDGTVATIANGAGLAMATVDAVSHAGLRPANFLDIGGNATTEGVVKSFQSIMQFPAIDAIIINIFGGIVRCDTVARAIIEARDQIDNLPRLAIRLSGNRSDEAAKLLESHGLTLHSSLTSCLEEIRS